MNKSIGILGCSYSLPPHIRTNDDPIFQHAKHTVNSQGVAEKDLFTGLKERRFLRPDDHIETYVVHAAQQALAQAQLQSDDIDRLYGYVSISSYLTPNALYAIHYALRLREQTLVLPINSEFSNFLLSVIQAWEAIIAEHCSYALVTCGTNWTQYMDYTQGHALSVGDGAGAVVVGPGGPFVLVDYATQTLSEQYGVMTMQTRSTAMNGRRFIPVDSQNIPIPTYEITLEGGLRSFQSNGREGPPSLVQRLLDKHGLRGNDIALITHQASRILMDYWRERIQPKEYLETLEQFGNLTMATYPVNLAYYFDQITADYVVLVALGVGFHQTALLLRKA